MPNNNQSEEVESVIEEFMWQMKGDQHNICGEYNPTFCDKQEKRLRTALTTHGASEYARGKSEERGRLFEEIKAYTFEACPYEGTMIRAFINNYNQINHEAYTK